MGGTQASTKITSGSANREQPRVRFPRSECSLSAEDVRSSPNEFTLTPVGCYAPAMLIKPDCLKPGDTVAAVSLSSGLTALVPHRYTAGKRQIEGTFGLK